ncbi:hypothetical protein BYT27DRAFT_7200608 [Phlegmacium glaucopus]|nr:hypothetical protein BYT27DRAFT_7200608 [Phlegmacium glaucopus]
MSSALRKLRIISIPLTRPNASLTLPNSIAKPSRLVYYQFQITVPRLVPASANTNKNRWLPEEGIAKWTMNRAANIWAGFGRKESGWQPKVYRAGERMVDRMEFEELALKSIDLSMSPSVAQFKSSPVPENKNAPLTIPLVFPPSILSPSEVLSELRQYTEHRIPKHRKGFYLWMLIAPMMTPFMIIPIIPNLPFFFCAWRSWSHYRAYRSSQYLQSLLDHDIIVPEASESLDEVYKLYPPTTSPSSLSSDPIPESNSSIPKTNLEREPQHQLLLRPEAVQAILSLLDLEPTTSADLHRALEQARLRVSSGRVNGYKGK